MDRPTDHQANRPADRPTDHPTDADLLLAADGELSPRRARAIRRHLDSCWNCRALVAETERTIANLMHARAADRSAEPPGLRAATLRLEMELARLDRAPSRWTLPRWARVTHLRYALVFAGAAALIAIIVHVSESPVRASSIPDPRLTPGAVRLLNRADVCTPTATASRRIPAGLAKAVFHEYGIPNPKPGAYEVDYLITPALGGADDIRNLWPQPYASGVWNAHIKDALETHLRGLVCEGKLDLTTAQRDIAADWIAAYRKYFRTDRPLAIHAAFTEDEPWG